MKTQRRYSIATIRSRTERENQILLTFSNGMRATFAKDDPASAMILRLAELANDTPVGLIIDPPDHIVSLTWTVKWKPGGFGEEVKRRRDIQSNPRYQGFYLLTFAGPAGIYRIAPDHPELDRIVATLKQAREQDREVCVSLVADLLVLDVRSADEVALETGAGGESNSANGLAGVADQVLDKAPSSG